MKILVGGLVALTVLFTGYVLYSTMVTNPGVIDELRDNPQGEVAFRVMLLTFADGRTIPVNYLQEGGIVYAGADGPWWRRLKEDAVVEVYIRGEALSGQATVVLDDQDFVDDVFSRLRPAAPQWLPAWFNGKLIVIKLDTSPQ